MKYHICIENFISRFGPNDVILHNKIIGFALIQNKDFCPINILNDTLRSKLKKHYQPSIFTQTSGNCFLEMAYTGDEINLKKIIYNSFIRRINFNKVTYNQIR